MADPSIINDLVSQTSLLQCNSEPNELPDSNPNEFTILAKILSDKPSNMVAFKTTMLKVWNSKNRIQANTIQQNLMSFIFEDQSEAQKILNLSWSFRESQIILQHWPPDKALMEVDMDLATFWIHVSNLPVYFINMSNALLIGNKIGTFIKADLHSTAQKWKKAFRIQVQIDTTQPLIDHILLPCQGRNDLHVEIRYERLADFCFSCGLLGHKIQVCKVMKVSTDMVNPLLRFGPWLKSENTLVPNPRMTKNPKNPRPTQESIQLIPSPSTQIEIEKTKNQRTTMAKNSMLQALE
ncbi:PREDICTED: uncharacterized protein LOC105963339 [Erythranthe guttata]|uniref:uncharacterized protein LOC105963339 n=1 Tax=Erythranthe guttata TaxID=4155 RepID=UPI00064D8634|nr:PREDICTED: uncharacterized protein LOC105963339 [Erythranthe guttata]|eukprot:XP_012843185.1 PREDICTED: uncharacterized protein LOC105963339 [Erythranthe guttata]